MFPWPLLGFLLCMLSAPAHAGPVEVFATPLPLNAQSPDTTRIDGLRYTGGLVLSSPDKRFGGWSGLLASPDGKHITSVSDNGFLLHLTLQWNADGRLSGIADADLRRLTDDTGAPLSGKRDTDAEALAQGLDGGFIVAFERQHRLETMDGDARPARLLTLPPQFPLMPRNGGVEALALLADGRLLALSEGFVTSNGLLGWLGTPDSDGNWNWDTVHYPYDGRNVPTGATVLPDGDVLVLERRYSPLEGLGARLRRIPARQMTAGAVLDGPLLASWAEPFAIDNLEGIAVFRPGQGGTRVLLISDDNYSALQRTLLLSFDLPKATH